MKRSVNILLLAVLVVGFAAGCTQNTDDAPVIHNYPLPPPPDTNKPNEPNHPTFSWPAVNGAISYDIQVSLSVTFADSVTTTQSSSTNSITWAPVLQFSRIYFWRVRAVSIGGTGDWSDYTMFTTEFNALSDEARGPR